MKPSAALILGCLAIGAVANPTAPINIGFNPLSAVQQARRLSTHSWEYGTAAEALLEYYNASLSVFSPSAFPGDHLPTAAISKTPSLVYAQPTIRTNNVTLIDGDGAAGDPCSLGVSALLIGQTRPAYRAAAARQADHLLYYVPRWPNGAISHREGYAELWADFIYMAPPFLAYYAVATGNASLLRFTAQQCDLYRQALLPPPSARGPSAVAAGTWRHILGPPTQDLGLWSTGNGWAAMGMARVLATALHWGPTACDADTHALLFAAIGQILDGARNGLTESRTGLLRNYLNDTTWFGETSGTSALTAAIYRTAVLQGEYQAAEKQCSPSYAGSRKVIRPVTSATLAWADAHRRAVVAHVNDSGIASPAVNPLGWGDRTPYTAGSPEGESFLVLLYAAWRDCIAAKVCEDN